MRLAAAIPVLAFVAGVCHGCTAREHALHTPLRDQLDAAVGGASIDRIDVIARHEPIMLRAVLSEDAADAGEFVSLRVEAEAMLVERRWREVSGGLVLSINGGVGRDRLGQWRAGRTIEAPVVFRRPTRYLNDGVPDFERDAALNGITLFGSVKSGLLIDVVRRGSVAAERAGEVRAAVRAAVTRWVLPHGDVPAAIVTAVLIGDRTGLPDDVRMRLQAAGTYHVIAISGGNIAILAAVILIVFAALGIHNRYGAIVAIVVLVTYAQIVSAGPSVWRATLMAILYFGARLFDHRTPSWYAMTLAAAIIAVAQPLDVRDAGFLLTFGATAGLLGAARFIAVRLPRHRVIAWVFGSVVASLAVEVVLVPVSAGVFSRVTAAGLLLNLVAVPAMALVQIAGMVVVVCDRFPPIAASSGWLAAQGAFALIDSARLIDVAPALVQRVPPPPAWIIAIYYVALVLAWRGSRRSRALPIIVLVSTGVLIVTGRDPFAATRPTDRLRVTTIDVGQGESILLDAPGVEPMLVDTGGSPFGGGAFDIGRRVLAPVLWKQGVRRLGALLVTHGDPDHLGGAEAVLADFQPRSLWWGTPVPPHEPSRQLLGTAHRQGSVVAFRRAGDTLAFGRAHIRILHPPPPDWERQKVRNDDSVVLEVVYGDVAILLTGDISSTVERQIAPQLTPARVRVLKVAHHGSRTSSSTELLDAWRPQIAVISCGRGNTFGHPAPEVLTRLQSIGARVYRTDRDGEITLESDGESVSVTTFTAERR